MMRLKPRLGLTGWEMTKNVYTFISLACCLTGKDQRAWTHHRVKQLLIWGQHWKSSDYHLLICTFTSWLHPVYRQDSPWPVWVRNVSVLFWKTLFFPNLKHTVLSSLTKSRSLPLTGQLHVLNTVWLLYIFSYMLYKSLLIQGLFITN